MSKWIYDGREGVETTPFYESLIMTSQSDFTYCYLAYSFVYIVTRARFLWRFPCWSVTRFLALLSSSQRKQSIPLIPIQTKQRLDIENSIIVLFIKRHWIYSGVRPGSDFLSNVGLRERAWMESQITLNKYHKIKIQVREIPPIAQSSQNIVLATRVVHSCLSRCSPKRQKWQFPFRAKMRLLPNPNSTSKYMRKTWGAAF